MPEWGWSHCPPSSRLGSQTKPRLDRSGKRGSVCLIPLPFWTCLAASRKAASGPGHCEKGEDDAPWEGVALSLHDVSACGSQSHLQIKGICFVQLGADKRRFAGGMVSGLFILLLVKPPLRGRRLGCFLSSGAAGHLLAVGPSAYSKRPRALWGFSPQPPEPHGASSSRLLTGSRWLMRREDLIPVQEEDESSVGLKSSSGDVCSSWQHGWALVEGGEGMCQGRWLEEGRCRRARGATLGLAISPATFAVSKSTGKLCSP